VSEGKKNLKKIITKGFFLDDLINGSDTEEVTTDLVNKIYALFERHGLILRKWSSNLPSCLKSIREGHTLEDMKEIVKAESKVSTLGMTRNPSKDRLMYKICLGDDQTHTKC
jgi:hypothetical protein